MNKDKLTGVSIRIPDKIPNMIFIKTDERTYATSELQLQFLKKIAENDVEYLDKFYKERPYLYWKLIHKLKKKGLIVGKGRPYRLTREGWKLLKAYSILLKGDSHEEKEEKKKKKRKAKSKHKKE